MPVTLVGEQTKSLPSGADILVRAGGGRLNDNKQVSSAVNKTIFGRNKCHERYKPSEMPESNSREGAAEDPEKPL